VERVVPFPTFGPPRCPYGVASSLPGDVDVGPWSGAYSSRVKGMGEQRRDERHRREVGVASVSLSRPNCVRLTGGRPHDGRADRAGLAALVMTVFARLHVEALTPEDIVRVVSRAR